MYMTQDHNRNGKLAQKSESLRKSILQRIKAHDAAVKLAEYMPDPEETTAHND